MLYITCTAYSYTGYCTARTICPVHCSSKHTPPYCLPYTSDDRSSIYQWASTQSCPVHFCNVQTSTLFQYSKPPRISAGADWMC